LIWNNCRLTILFYDEPAQEMTCVVKFTDAGIMVEYEDDGVVQYAGGKKGDGHFELLAPAVHGRATLHMFPDSTRLEGSWIEDGERGMWRIDLAE